MRPILQLSGPSQGVKSLSTWPLSRAATPVTRVIKQQPVNSQLLVNEFRNLFAVTFQCIQCVLHCQIDRLLDVFTHVVNLVHAAAWLSTTQHTESSVENGLTSFIDDDVTGARRKLMIYTSFIVPNVTTTIPVISGCCKTQNGLIIWYPFWYQLTHVVLQY